MSFNEEHRDEIFAGIFNKHSWTPQSLSDYFLRLIPSSSIDYCKFYSSTNPKHPNYCFAILKFDSIASVDQCLEKREQIKYEIRLLVKRNITNTSKNQRSPSEHILIHTNQYDRTFHTKNVLTYFEKYGSIIKWNIVDHGRTFLLHFQDYDSVDRILLDKPHFLNERLLTIEKYHPSEKSSSTYSFLLKERITNFETAIHRLNYSYQFQLKKNRRFFQEKLLEKEKQLSEKIKKFLYLKQDVDNLRQINIQLKKQLEQIVYKNRTISDDYDDQLQQQRFINLFSRELVLENSDDI